jgi:hypothetical protein
MRLRSGGAYASELPPQNALPHDVLVRIFSLLPRDALAVTPGRVSHAWAAAKAEAWAAAAPKRAPRQPDDSGYDSEDNELEFARCRPFLPPWYVRSVYGAAPRAAKLVMIHAACYHGQLDVVAELYAADSELLTSDAQACNEAALGRQLSVLRWLRQNNCPWDRVTHIIAADIAAFVAVRGVYAICWPPLLPPPSFRQYITRCAALCASKARPVRPVRQKRGSKKEAAAPGRARPSKAFFFFCLFVSPAPFSIAQLNASTLKGTCTITARRGTRKRASTSPRKGAWMCCSFCTKTAARGTQ